MATPELKTIPHLPTPLTADYIFDDAATERQEYDYYAWELGETEQRYFILAALNYDIHPDPLARLEGAPMRYPSKATYAAYSNED